MWDPTRIVGIDPPLKPESEPRLPECGAWPVYGDSSPSKTHSIPPSCPLNEAESQAPALNNRTTATRNIGPFADTEFVFESRAILIGPNQAPISRQRKPRDGSALECGFPGCHSRATFERKYELQRHMKKHERQVTYPCPAIDCDRIGLRSFYRMDKPVHHLRTGHGNNDSYRCPLEECSVGPMPIEGIALHTRDHRYTSNRMLRVFQRIPRDKRQCMLKGCSKQLSIWNMQSHLTSRTINHRMKETSVIQRMGYDAETGKIICPLCKALLCNHDRFITHLEYDHFIADPAHFSKFKESTNDMPLPGPRYSWKSWMPHSYLTVLGSNWTMVGSNWTGLQGRTCPTYRQPASSGDRPGHVDHHLQLRADLDVRPYRWDILRLWPEFDSHPVFNDIKLSVHV
ncbi:hypothetical protein AOQ84DRAFT_136847 [Glonium stellatum]|uniref:C2H2-type domain-containing protein n=1 Tax=Glonium stellatum TaxID=574774 RepID=A0A8E2FDD4_9PEZI|nr:hypothetical protein AOQ84DRAFT_136847 [Glonium stellatum]